MTRLQFAKTSFTSGEIDPELMGRVDLNAYAEGAAKLRNVLVKLTGGVSRRCGTKHIKTLPGAECIIPFDTRNGERVVSLGASEIAIVDASAQIDATFEAIWSATQLVQITWTYVDGGLLICHPDTQPRLLKHNQAGGWSLDRWVFEELEGDNGNYSSQPYAKLVDSNITLQPSNLNIANPDEEDAISAGADVQLLATAPMFEDDHFGTIFRLKGREVRIQSVISSVEARAIVLQELVDGKATRYFEEQVYSEARGWPATVTQHQDRLVIAGNPGAAELICFSKTGDYFNFDFGTGLDDEAISFRLSDSRLHRVCQMSGGSRLKILTNLGEWVVSGSPLTPSNIQLDQQTNVGSPTDRQVRPVEVDGAMVFVGASKRDVREFIYADAEQAFQAPDIALLSRHLIDKPVDMAFALEQRLLAIVCEDGALATATLDRNANIVAWTRQELGGDVKSVAIFDKKLHLLVERNGDRRLEAFDTQRVLDAAVSVTAENAQSLWSGFTHLIGQVIRVMADETDLGEYLVTGDVLDIGVEARTLLAGLTFAHEIEPLPISLLARAMSLDTLYRPVRSVFRVHETRSLRVETARGERVLLPPTAAGTSASGDYSLRDYGWRRGQGQWPWRIQQSDPLPFTLLSATTEIKVNN